MRNEQNLSGILAILAIIVVLELVWRDESMGALLPQSCTDNAHTTTTTAQVQHSTGTGPQSQEARPSAGRSDGRGTRSCWSCAPPCARPAAQRQRRPRRPAGRRRGGTKAPAAAGGGGGDGAGLSRKARQRLEAQRWAAEAKRLKKERAQVRAQEEAAKAAAAPAVPAGQEEKEAGEEVVGGDSSGADAVAAAVATVTLEEAATPATPALQQDEEAEDECPICLLELCGAEGQETLGGCGHAFHGRCLDGWREVCQRKGLPLSCLYCRQKR